MSDLAGYYSALLEMFAESTFDAGACIVLDKPRSSDALLTGLGEIVDISAPAGFEQLVELNRAPNGGTVRAAPAAAWMISEADRIVLFDTAGVAAVSPITLSSLSWAASQVSSVHWNQALGLARLALAVSGDVEILEPNAAGALDRRHAPRLSRYIGQLQRADSEGRTDDDRAVGLAVVECSTGFRLSLDHLTQPWPVITFTEREPPSDVGMFARRDAVLGTALDEAPSAKQVQAMTLVVGAVVEACDFSGIAAVNEAAAQITEGRALERGQSLPQGLIELMSQLNDQVPPPLGGAPAYEDERWQRLQGASMLSSFLRPQPRGKPQYLFGWQQAAWALNDGWPGVRDRVLLLLNEYAS